MTDVSEELPPPATGSVIPATDPDEEDEEAKREGELAIGATVWTDECGDTRLRVSMRRSKLAFAFKVNNKSNRDPASGSVGSEPLKESERPLSTGRSERWRASNAHSCAAKDCRRGTHTELWRSCCSRKGRSADTASRCTSADGECPSSPLALSPACGGHASSSAHSTSSRCSHTALLPDRCALMSCMDHSSAVVCCALLRPVP
mmetsp:Transcript_6614/g.20130  ORF Transcript_6614/g.20130 Transcript_6614/m.20130 type:complete len:204 (-) Transcript_6614:598-1209(-)